MGEGGWDLNEGGRKVKEEEEEARNSGEDEIDEN